MRREDIREGTQAMLGTRYTSRPYTTLAGLRRALLPFMHLGSWSVLRETGWSRSGRPRPQFVGVVLDGVATVVLQGNVRQRCESGFDSFVTGLGAERIR